MPVTSAKLQCETQLRLIYFDFKFLSFALTLAKTLSDFHPVAINLEVIKDSLIAIKPQYSAIKAVIDAIQEPSARQVEQLKKHSETLQKALQQTQQYRQQLCRYIQFFVNLENGTFDDVQAANFLLTLPLIKRLWIDMNKQIEIAVILSLSYTLATAARSLSGSVMNLAEARLFDNTNQLASHTRNLFLKPWLQQLAYICGYRLGGRVYNSGVRFFTPTPSAQTLLADPKLCAEHQKACHEAALETLELPTDTPAQEINIHSAFHRLSKKYHPDKVSGEDSHHANEKFIDIRNARDRMNEFFL